MPGYKETQRRRLRRPIDPGEVEHLERLGAGVRELREQAQLTRPELGALAEISAFTIRDIELAMARTRETTLRRIVEAVAVALRNLDKRAVLLRLVELAGSALAPESKHQARIEARRQRWARRGRFGRVPIGFQRPWPGETPERFLMRMAKRGDATYVCLSCGRAAIGLHRSS